MSSLDDELAPLRIPLEDILIATDNFAEENLIKRGRKVVIYKGVLVWLWCKVYEEIEVIVIRGHMFKFYEEIKRLSRFNHRNAASFIGFCDEKDESMVVMEHAVNGTLDKQLSNPTFTWSQRLHVCFGAALALSYWHEKTPYFYKGGFKILLDKDWEAKVVISFDSESENSDVYGLGVVLMEVLLGRKATIKDLFEYQDKMRRKHCDGGHLDDIVHPNLRKQMHPESLSIFSELTHDCLKEQGYYKIVERLREAFEIQWKHENLILNQMSSLDDELAPLRLPLDDILNATNNFDEVNLLKRGRKVNIYKGVLLWPWCKVDLEIEVIVIRGHMFKFYEEIKRLSHFNHRNAASFIGFCDEKDESMVVMEHAVNGTLDKQLSNPTFTWSQRLHVCFGAALALSYWHEKTPYFYKGGFKILLDKEWEAKVVISFDSELENSDVYGLGVVLMEVLLGRKATIKDLFEYQDKMRRKHCDGGHLDDIVHPNLRKQMHPESLSIFSELTHDCLKEQGYYMIVERLREAFEIQWKHENLLLVEKFAYFKIPLSHIKLATNQFSHAHCIKSGIYESVYKGELGHFDRESGFSIDSNNKVELPKKTVIINRIEKYKKIPKDFFEEIEMLTSCKHPNLLTFIGFCDEDFEMILVFECDFKETLYDYLRSTRNRTNLTWEKRMRICLDIAHGLKHLHNIEGKPTMIHHVIHSENVFLDEKWTAKISNFRTWLPSAIDPPKTHQRHVVDDIYSYGVLLFQILTGKLDYDPHASMAQHEFDEGKPKNMADAGLIEEAQECSFAATKGPSEDSLNAFFRIAYQCVVETPCERPRLEDVIKSLEKALHFQYVMLQVQKLEHLKIPLKNIKAATESFDIKYLIGSGGYGEVYKAKLNIKCKDEHHDMANTVAIKRIKSRNDGQENEGFLVELDVVSKCKHPNIVSLLGFCVEDGEMLLVYELVSKGSLDEYLSSVDRMVNFTWKKRLRLCIDIAQGLKHMHTTMEAQNGIIHRDIKSANILLGENLEAKIADFGLSRVHHGNQGVSTINTQTLAGTDFYLDPEYARTGRLKKASDIYSLGVVLFEIFSGKLAYHSHYIRKNEKGLAPIARRHFKNGTVKEILDPKIMDDAYEHGFAGKVQPDDDSLNVFSRIAYQCLAKAQLDRPTIEVIIEELEKSLYLQENRIKTLNISFRDIKLGVEYFGCERMLYKGKVKYNNRHQRVIVKRFSHIWYLIDTNSSSYRGFLKEFEVLFKYKHENIIGLVGYCYKMDEKIILYEHASKGSLDRYLDDISFSWTKRIKICIDIANGLKFLHGGDLGQDVVIYRDIKSSNILLDKDCKAKICGFECALAYPSNQEKEIVYAIDNVKGSSGYMDPLYEETRILTKESDIYSFGVILIEILCGGLGLPEELRSSHYVSCALFEGRSIEEAIKKIVFKGIKEQIGRKSFTIFRRIAFQCLLHDRKERPTASDVVVHLQKALEFQEAYEIRKANRHKNNKEMLSKSHKNHSAMAKKDIYNILSKGILLEDDKLEIMQVLKGTLDLEQVIQEEEDNYIPITLKDEMVALSSTMVTP